MAGLQRYLLLFLLLLVSCKVIKSQESAIINIYSKAVNIDNGFLPVPKKLAALYQLKAETESRGLVRDSGYIVTLIKIAKNEYRQNNYNKAIQYNLQALNLIKKPEYTISGNIILNTYYNLAYCYNAISAYSKALAYFDTTLLLARQYDIDSYNVDTRYVKTRIYFWIGDYEKVKDESTLGIADALNENDTTYYLSFLNHRAYSLMYFGNLQEALADVDKIIALIIEQKLVEPKYDLELATAFNTKALICDREKNYKEAELHFKKSIAVRPHQYAKCEVIANDYNDLANFYLHSLNDYQKAKENYLTTISYAKKCDTTMRKLVLFMAYSNLAEVAIKQHLYTNAVHCYNEALSYIGVSNVSNPFLENIASNQLTAVNNTNVLFPFLFGKTELLLTLYKHAHQASYLKACLQTAMLTDTLITQTRHENLGEKSKLYWRDVTRDFFSNVIEACYLSKNINTAFYFMEKSRAVLLNDKWNELSAASHLNDLDKAQLRNLQIKVIDEQQVLSTLKINSKHYLQTENSLLRARNDLNNYIRLLEKKYPAYYQNKYADNVPTLDSLQQYLAKNNKSFVHYFMNDTVLYALGISKNGTLFKKLSGTEFDNRQLADFLSLCSDKEKLNSSYYTSFVPLAQNIYNHLFKPLQLPKGDVAICTDNFLIPFEALCTDAKGKNFLLADYSFSYVYSARTFMKPFINNTAATGNFIGFAPVAFAPTLQLVPLMQSADSLSKSAGFYSHHTLFTNAKATRKHFFENASGYAVVTIFSHAYADTSEREPVLYMQDAPIHLSELQLLKNPSAQFVLLSACQTNIGKTATGEGIYSLARGFATVGIPAVAGTLWKADDQTIYTISSKFNEYLADGMDKSEALQKAKLWFLQNHSNNERLLPYYWANMVLIGNTQPIHLIQENYTWRGIRIILSVTVIALTLMVLKRRIRLRLNGKKVDTVHQEQLIRS